MKIYDFKVENQVNPLGLDIAKPVFSWKLSSEIKNTMQQEYDLKLFCNNEKIWNSNFHSSESVGIVYNGEPLLPFEKYRATLSVTDNNGNTAGSELTFETGKLGNEFTAIFIAPKNCKHPVFTLNKDIDVSKQVVKARLYIVAYKEAKEFLERIAPGIFDGPLVSFAMNMTLTEVCAYSGAEGVKMFEALLEYMNGLYESGAIR